MHYIKETLNTYLALRKAYWPWLTCRNRIRNLSINQYAANNCASCNSVHKWSVGKQRENKQKQTIQHILSWHISSQSQACVAYNTVNVLVSSGSMSVCVCCKSLSLSKQYSHHRHILNCMADIHEAVICPMDKCYWCVNVFNKYYFFAILFFYCMIYVLSITEWQSC